jgi:hypothetical protein
MEGLLWRIGSGNKLCIWGEKWLPLPTSYIVHSPLRVLSADALVRELIDHDSNWWNVSLIKEIFSAEEVKAIMSIRLSTSIIRTFLFEGYYEWSFHSG